MTMVVLVLTAPATSGRLPLSRPEAPAEPLSEAPASSSLSVLSVIKAGSALARSLAELVRPGAVGALSNEQLTAADK